MILLQSNVTGPGRDDEIVRLTTRVAREPFPMLPPVSPAVSTAASITRKEGPYGCGIRVR